MDSLYNYLKERFPALPLFVFTILTLSGIAKNIQYDGKYIHVLLLALVYLGFLFHLRILDEFKDYNYDKKYHSQRPVQRGSISLTTIRNLGIINLLVITLLSFIVNHSYQFILFVFVILYTFLMFKEFYIKSFYEKSPTIYLFSHQIVFIPLYLYFFLSLENTINFLGGLSSASLFIYTIIPVILVEIGRKMNHRLDSKGNKTNDTYVYVWGEKNTILIFFLLVMFGGFMGRFINNFLLIYSNMIVSFGLLLLIIGMFEPKKIMENNMLITILCVLGIPLMLLL